MKIIKPYCYGCQFRNTQARFQWWKGTRTERACRYQHICGRINSIHAKEAETSTKPIVLHIEDGEVLHIYVPNDGNSYVVHGKDFDYRCLEGAGEYDGAVHECINLQAIIDFYGLITDTESQKYRTF